MYCQCYVVYLYVILSCNVINQLVCFLNSENVEYLIQ